MKKILIIGCPGSGKSTFTRKLHAETGIPLYHLDMLYWNEDKTTVPHEEFLRRLNTVMQRDSWIIDGNYKNSLELRLTHCDTVFFLDYPLEICLDGIYHRIGSPRSDMPWIETADDAAELAAYAHDFFEGDRTHILDLLRQTSTAERIIFNNRNTAEQYLNKQSHK